MDYLFRGLARNSKVRVIGVDASESIAKICSAHNTLPITTVVFSRFLLAGTMMGVLEKANNGISMQINSDGPMKSLFMQATRNGLIRGYVSNPKGDLELEENKLSIEGVVGDNGILSVIKTSELGEDFVSDVILTECNITKDIAYYFFTSEQIPTILNLQVDLNQDGGVKEAKGYLIQLLTGYEEEDVRFLESLKLDRIENLEEDVKKIFTDFEKLEEIPVRDICDCNKERFLNGLATLSSEDLDELASEDVEVVCQFCQKSYVFTPSELNQLKENKK